MQSEEQLVVYPSRRSTLRRRNESNSKISCNKRRNSVNAFPNRRVTVQKNSEENADKKVKRERKKKNKKKRVECDEATRLQNRANYLLIKIKFELNLIDAYSGDGWKGRSKEKIKPEKELQRAENEIKRCKLGIREIVHQFDTLISTCNCGNNHQISSEPPIQTNCINFESKKKILEGINAHLCTNYSLNSSYEDIFKEATVNNPDSENKNEEEWPSEESGDEDYSPDLSPTCGTTSEDFDFEDSDNDTHHSVFIDEVDNCEIIQHRRERVDVDYKKLHDEMFGKDAIDEEESSEDDEWGPPAAKKISRQQESEKFVLLDISNCLPVPKKLERTLPNKKPEAIISPLTKQENKGKEVIAKKTYPTRLNRSKLHKNPAGRLKSNEGSDCEWEKGEEEKMSLDVVEKMCKLQNRVLNLKKELRSRGGTSNNRATRATRSQEQRVIYVPVAQLFENS